MTKIPRLDTSILAYLFTLFLMITIVIYVLRGFGIFTFIPGGIILLFMFLAVFTGIIYGIEKTRRF